MKKVLCWIGVLTMLVSMLCVGQVATASALSGTEVIALYKAKLREYPESVRHVMSYNNTVYYTYNYYTIYDIDKNGTEELIVKQDSYKYHIYTILNGQCLLVETADDDLFWWNYPDPLYDYNGNGLIVHDGGMGNMHFEQVYLFTLQSGKLKRSVILEELIAANSGGYARIQAELAKHNSLNNFVKVRDYSLLNTMAQHTVSYNANGGSGAPSAQTKVEGTPLTLSTKIPTRSGYAFVGWSTSKSATTAAYHPGGQFKNNTDTTLYAVWKKDAYRITFAGNGGSGVPNAQIKVKGTPLTLSSQIPTRSGYAFVGWSTSSSATTAAYHPGGQFKNNSQTTLYAVWKKDAYRITFAGNGGSGVPNAQIKVKGTALKLSSQIPTRSGYAFVGWSTSPSATTAAYQPGWSFKNNSTTTLYAVWKKDAYRVSYNANGGSGAPAVQFKIKGKPLTLSTQKPTRAGYKFLGWSTNKDAKAGTYASGAQYKNNTHTTLYAVWKKSS